MIKKSVKRLISFIIAVLLVVLTTVPVCADPETSVYKAIKGTTTTFKKYLVVDKYADIPGTDFSFTIKAAADSDISQTEGQLEVYAGPDADKVKIGMNGKTIFVPGQSTTAGTETDGIVKDINKKYAVNEVTVDFSRISFDQPGIYRYIITEAAQPEGSLFTNDEVPTRTLDVYIQDNKGKLQVQGYVMYKDSVKSDGFINSYMTYELTAGKQVTGNQGSKDKYFKYTITLTGNDIEEDRFYTVLGEGYDAEPEKTGSTTYTNMEQPADADGIDGNGIQVKGSTLKSGLVVYLKHGQYIKIAGIPSGTEYEVAEDKENYTSTASSADNTVTFSSIEAKDSVKGILDSDKVVGFKNKKESVIPTGIILSVAPWIILGVVVVAGIIFFAVRSRKKYDEE